MEPTRSSTPGPLHRLLLRLDPERAHNLALGALRLASASRAGERALRRRFAEHGTAGLRQRLLGREFAHPLGLAAGFDKNAVAIQGFGALGFGFVEVGTVTPLAQPGNPRPRIFRHPLEQSLQNALGFNNDGMEKIRRRVARMWPLPFPVGVNVGKNASTPLEEAESDYERLFRGFAGTADYFVINISSPNTPGLRDLQSPERVTGLINRGRQLTRGPVLIKLSPDLSNRAALDLVGTAIDAGAAGVILTNTTTDYSLVPGAREVGGLSGRVLRERSFELLQEVAAAYFGRILIMSVGGVDSGDEAYRRLRAGASLVQLYTALVYQGPGLIGRAVARISELLERDGYDTIQQAVGCDVRPR